MNKNKYVIFGCGFHGRAVYRKLKLQKKSILIWVDNDKKKKSKKLFRVPIKPVKFLKNINYDKIIFSGRYITEQLNQYKKLKLDKSKIVIYDALKLRGNKKQKILREISAVRILKKILLILSKEKITYWVDLSGLLQVVRDKKISYLSDFDLSFYYMDHNKIIKLFKHSRSFKFFKKKIKQNYYKIFITGKNNNKLFEPPIFDFHFKVQDGNWTRDIDGITRSIPSKFLKSFKDYKLTKELKLRIPSSYIAYLQYLYGKSNWKKKIPFFKETLIKKNKLFLGGVDGQ